MIRAPLALFGLLLAALPALAGDDPPAKDGQHTDALRAGPMLGYRGLRTTAVWLQTERRAEVQLRYHPVGAPGHARLTAARVTKKAEQFATTIVLDELTQGTKYVYELYLDGARVTRPWPFRFTTAPFLRGRDPRPTVTLLTGSCSYVHEPGTARNPKAPYGGGYGIFEAMAKHGGDAMLWLGDNVYFREVDYHTKQGLFRRYRYDRALPQLQPLLAAMHHYALWDDHDFGPNNSDSSYALKGAALQAFKRYWPGVQYGLPEHPGVFQRFSLNDVDVITVDGRYHRTPNAAPPGRKKRAIGKKQMTWLKHTLLKARGSFKLVVTGNQWLNRVTPYESMHLYAHEVEELIAWIAHHRIRGVVFLSGDRHHTELLKVTRPGLYPLYELTSSPLTSRSHKIGPKNPEFRNPDRVPGTLVGVRNFGVLKFSGPRRDRQLTIEARDAKNTLLWSRAIRARDLSFPRRARRRRGKLY